MPLWALHLSDGVVTPAWWIGGMVAGAFLVLLGSWRLRDEDIPRVALLCAAFFVVSLIHVPVPGGPRAHLLLAGLLGVVLGRHAALAIPLGLVLQAILFSHGGLTMIGINSVVMTVPALLACGIFAGVRRLPGHRTPAFRAGLIFVSVVLFLLSAVFAGAMLATNPWTETEHGLVTVPAIAWTFAPWVLALVAGVGLLVVLLERRQPAGPEFALGLLVGEIAVLVAVAINGTVLLLGGVADWHTMVFLTVLIHLPLAVVEGIVLGFTVRFLARVQPELIGLTREPALEEPSTAAPGRASANIVALLLVLLVPAAARAHGFLAEAKVYLATKEIAIECWYDTGDIPKKALLTVKRADGSVVRTGQFDARGAYRFHYDTAEDLTLEIDAGAGHRATVAIAASQLTATPGPATAASTPSVSISSQNRALLPLRELVTGLAFLLALAAFGLGLRNARKLGELERARPRT